jgi:hypothetical protein
MCYVIFFFFSNGEPILGLRSFMRGQKVSSDEWKVADLVIKYLKNIETLEPIDEHRVRGVI